MNYTLHILRALLKDAVEHGYITDNPVVKVPLLQTSDGADVLHVLTPQEISRVLEVAEHLGARSTSLLRILGCAAASSLGYGGVT